MAAVSLVVVRGGGVSHSLADPQRMCMFTEVFSQIFALRSMLERPHGLEDVLTGIVVHFLQYAQIHLMRW